MHIFLLKHNSFKALFLLFIFLSTILIIFNIWFPHEAFAMAPSLDIDGVLRSFNPDSYIRYELDGNPVSKVEKLKYWDQNKSRWYTDFYGTREYRGKDAYGYFHQPQNLDKATQVEPLSSTKTAYDNPYKASNNTDNQVSPNRTNTNYQELAGKSIDKSKCKPEHELHLSKGKNIYSFSGNKSRVYELDGKAVYKSVNASYDRDELHFWSTGQCIIGNNPVHYYFEPRHTTFELDANCYEDTVSTSMNSTRFNNAVEFVRNYKLDCISTKHGVLSNINLGIKTTRTNIIFIYIKFQQIGKRKVLWNIWEKHSNRYESYNDFKRTWDSNIGIFSKIRKDIRENIRSEVEDLLGVKKINKNLKRSVKTEIEKLLREQRPFKY